LSLDLGAEPVGNTPQEFARLIKIQSDVWAKVFRENNIRLD
jgi:tripartite-type tricarboxylate transporter receptor subunit TctC